MTSHAGQRFEIREFHGFIQETRDGRINDTQSLCCEAPRGLGTLSLSNFNKGSRRKRVVCALLAREHLLGGTKGVLEKENGKTSV